MIELTHLHEHGVFLRREAIALGYDDKHLQQAMRAGLIARVRQGAYTSAQRWTGANELQRHQIRCHAVIATHGDQVALSHTSAAVMHGISVWNADLARVHVTRLDRTATRVCRDIRYHRGQVPAEHLVELSPGMRVSVPARAAVDHASISSIESGLVTVDSYLHLFRQREPSWLRAIHDARAGWPGNRRLQITLRLARPGAESVGETRLRYLCWEFHLPEPELQRPVYDVNGHLVGLSDFRWSSHRLLGEFDGRVKYERLLRPGETASDAVIREKRREDLMREITGYSMLRFVWADLRDRQRTAARIRERLGLA